MADRLRSPGRNISIFLFLSSGYREKLYLRCRHLKKEKLLQEVFTESGDVTVVMELEEGKLQTNIVTSEKEIDKIEAHLRAIKQLQLKE